MNTAKKTLSVILALMLLFTLLPAFPAIAVTQVAQQQSVTTDDPLVPVTDINARRHNCVVYAGFHFIEVFLNTAQHKFREICKR